MLNLPSTERRVCRTPVAPPKGFLTLPRLISRWGQHVKHLQRGHLQRLCFCQNLDHFGGRCHEAMEDLPPFSFFPEIGIRWLQNLLTQRRIWPAFLPAYCDSNLPIAMPKVSARGEICS